MRQYTELAERCNGPDGRGTPEQGYPGVDGSNGCDMLNSLFPQNCCAALDGNAQRACVLDAVSLFNEFVENEFYAVED